MSSIYERLGGESAVMAAVGIFYEKVTADPLLAPFFNRLDMKAQSRKQVAFMTWAFGGPNEYRGRDLTEAHAPLVRNLGLSDVHFDAVAMHLKATLDELGVPVEISADAIGTVAGLRRAVLGR